MKDFIKISSMLGLIGWLTTFQASAQNQKIEINQLLVGDQCPNFQFNNIINGEKKTMTLSDYNGKIVILDFWATWCGPCVSTMTHLDSLQKYFGDKIAVLQITNEDSTVVSNFKKTNPIINNIDLPSVTGKNQLADYFPHYMIPHTIIIDESGIVKSITTPEEITVDKLNMILVGKYARMKQKEDRLSYNSDKPLLAGGLESISPVDLSVVKYSSLLTNKIEGLPGSVSGPEVFGQYSKISCINTYIQHIYLSAFATKNRPYLNDKDPEFNLRFLSRIIWHAKDSSNFFWPGKKREDINKIRLFTYELVAPRGDSAMLNQYMIQDLNRYFGRMYHIEARLIYKKTKCLILTDKGKKESWKSMGGSKEYHISNDAKFIRVKNYPLSAFLFNWMNFSMYLYPYPILDETGYSGLINICLQADPTNIVSINKELSRYGLEFKTQKRKVKMILIENVK